MFSGPNGWLGHWNTLKLPWLPQTWPTIPVIPVGFGQFSWTGGETPGPRLSILKLFHMDSGPASAKNAPMLEKVCVWVVFVNPPGYTLS